MTIATSITTALQSLINQVAAANPMASASQATRTALKLNAGNLLASIQAALVAPSILDTWSAPTDAPSMIAGVAQVYCDAQDQSNLCLMRGVVGRAASNLDQLP